MDKIDVNSRFTQDTVALSNNAFISKVQKLNHNIPQQFQIFHTYGTDPQNK